MKNIRLELVIDKEERFKTGHDAASLFRRTGMHKSPQETFWALAYGPELNVASVFEVNRGKYLSVDLHIPSLLTGVLMSGCERFYLAHNHPGGNTQPSQADIDLTVNVMAAANATRLYLEDHLILTPSGGFYSFTSDGLIVPANPYFDAAARQ